MIVPATVRRGLGIAPPGGSSLIARNLGVTDCSKTLGWLLDAGCWGYSPSAWDQMSQFNQPPAPMPSPAVAGALSTTPAPYQCASGSLVTAATNCPEYSAAIDAALTAGASDTQAANIAFFGTQPYVSGASSLLSSTWLWIGAAVVAGLLVLGMVRR